MPTGYIDMAAMNSALAVLEHGKDCTASRWHWDNLLEVTYFLMWDNIKVAPGTKRPGPASGTYEYVVRHFDWLQSHTEHQDSAKQKTKVWLEDDTEQLVKAWEASRRNDDFLAWVEFQRDTFWARHSAVYGALCEEEWIPYIAQTLGVEDKDVRRIHDESRSPQIVEKWRKEYGQSVTPRKPELAEDIWVVSGMIRGKFHECIAADHGQQLLQHQFRKGIQRPLPESQMQEVSSSEDYFARLIVSCALDGEGKEQRVENWAKYTKAAREMLKIDRYMIREAKTEGDLDLILRTAAEKVGMQIETKNAWKILGSVERWRITKLAKFAIYQWSPRAKQIVEATEGAASAVKELRKSSLEKELKSKYKSIEKVRSIPGRIERRFEQRS